jgi:hypothetical protein
VNKREAKRLACDRAATLLSQEIDGGGIYAEGDNEEDIEKVEEALKELREEMWRRGERADWDKIRQDEGS